MVAAALSGDPSMPTRTSTGPLPGSPLATSRVHQGRSLLTSTSASSSAIGPEQQAEQPPGEGAVAKSAHHDRQHEPDAHERHHQQRQERGG